VKRYGNLRWRSGDVFGLGYCNISLAIRPLQNDVGSAMATLIPIFKIGRTAFILTMQHQDEA